MRSIYLVCEGQEGSLDRLVLTKLLNDHLGFIHVLIESAGGDSSLSSVAQFLTRKYRDSDIFSVEDRNYKPRNEAESSWNQKSKKLIWSRHEIENYLITPTVVSNTFEKLREDVDGIPKELPQNPPDVQNWLSKLAFPMRENHVGWCCYYRLMPYRFGYNFQIKHPADFVNNTSRETWLEYLVKESSDRQTQSQKYGTDLRFSATAIEKQYEEILTEISGPTYWDAGEYLVDFGGKEIIDEMMREFARQNFKISRNDLEERLTESLIQSYQQNTFRPNDFIKLEKRLRGE